MVPSDKKESKRTGETSIKEKKTIPELTTRVQQLIIEHDLHRVHTSADFAKQLSSVQINVMLDGIGQINERLLSLQCRIIDIENRYTKGYIRENAERRERRDRGISLLLNDIETSSHWMTDPRDNILSSEVRNKIQSTQRNIENKVDGFNEGHDYCKVKAYFVYSERLGCCRGPLMSMAHPLYHQHGYTSTIMNQLALMLYMKYFESATGDRYSRYQLLQFNEDTSIRCIIGENQ
jgi:hypothetical protein